MDFRKLLQDCVEQRLTMPALIDALDRMIAAAPAQREILHTQLEAFNRDLGLPSDVYVALRAHLIDSRPASSTEDETSEATVVASRPLPESSEAEATVVAVRTPADERNATVLASRPAAVAEQDESPSQALDLSSLTIPGSVDTSQQEALVPGMVLKDRFVLEEVLGVGGMSMVFRARDLRKEEAQDRTPHVAIKVLGPEFKNHPESLKVLQREAKKAQTLAHPNIVNVFDFDRDGHTIFMTMEVLEGQGLDKLIRAHKTGGLPPAEALPIVEGIARALGYAHEKGIVHSDLKPGNVYITTDKTVKVLDFGIARARRDGNAEADNFDAGDLGALTPAYASPEMIEGREPDPRDDIYALGCITYELLTGHHPFARKAAVEARAANMQAAPVAGLKRRQWAALRQALAFEREARSADVLQFLYELKPHRLPWKLIAAAAVVIAGSLGGWAYYAYQNRQLAQELGDELARQAPVSLTPAQQAKIKDFLDIGKLYMSLGQYAAPPGDSAFDAYQKVLAIDPRNQEARDGERKIAAYYQDQGRAALNNGDLAKAKTMIELGLYVRPADKDLLGLKKELQNKRSGG